MGDFRFLLVFACGAVQIAILVDVAVVLLVVFLAVAVPHFFPAVVSADAD